MIGLGQNHKNGNVADLYRLKDVAEGKFTLIKQASKIFNCENKVSFKSGAGAVIDKNENLGIVACVYNTEQTSYLNYFGKKPEKNKILPAHSHNDFILLDFIFLISCQNNRSTQNKIQEKVTQLKVAAWNVEYSENATTSEIGEALKPFYFDVVCFSEAPGGDWTKEVGTVMGLENVVVGKYSTAGHDDKYKTIVSRTPLYGFGEVLMADTLHTVTKAKTKINNTEIAVYAVHFPFGWRDQAHIDETTNKIATFINYLKALQKDEISVVAGDFNFIPSNADSISMYHEMFIETGLDVSWKALGIDCTKQNTYYALKPEDQGSGEVIDHVFYNPEKMKVLDGQIIEMEKPLSDHKPV